MTSYLNAASTYWISHSKYFSMTQSSHDSPPLNSTRLSFWSLSITPEHQLNGGLHRKGGAKALVPTYVSRTKTQGRCRLVLNMAECSEYSCSQLLISHIVWTAVISVRWDGLSHVVWTAQHLWLTFTAWKDLWGVKALPTPPWGQKTPLLSKITPRLLSE